MFLLTSTLIFISAVVSQCHAEQKLECPYTSEKKNLQRVWCKKDTENPNCCTGYSFDSGNKQLEDGRLSVTDNGSSFTVSVKSVSQGDGVYWCGLKDGNIFVKLGEKEIHNPMDFVWTILRYLFFGLLLLAVISSHVCCIRKKPKE